MSEKYQACLVHGKNISQKESSRGKYNDDESNAHLSEIRTRYDKWKSDNIALVGPTSKPSPNDAKIIQERTRLFSDYKEFIDQQKYAEKFDSRSNLHSSVLEEFMFYRLRDLVQDFPNEPLIGKSRAFKDIFFFPTDYTEMVSSPHARIEIKDHDFVIGTQIQAEFKARGSSQVQRETLDIAAVAIECKTYLDKTTLEASSTAATQLKSRNPNGLYIVVMEWLKLTQNVNLKKYAVDQIYVFRKQKNTDREYRYLDGYVKKPIDFEVVEHLFETVRHHLTTPWSGGVADGLERGWLLD